MSTASKMLRYYKCMLPVYFGGNRSKRMHYLREMVKVNYATLMRDPSYPIAMVSMDTRKSTAWVDLPVTVVFSFYCALLRREEKLLTRASTPSSISNPIHLRSTP